MTLLLLLASLALSTQANPQLPQSRAGRRQKFGNQAEEALGSRASVFFKQLREDAGSGGESREVGMQKLKQGSASKSEGRVG